MTECLNIVELIENNPVTRLSNTYQNKLITKIKTNFTDSEQQMFVASFYCYLNYNSKTDFVIDLDNVWKWLGFNQKVKAKELLEKSFKKDIDYKKSLSQLGKQSTHTKGGHNKEYFMMTVKTFKLLCLKACTKKADQIHEYYIKLEETLQEVIQEESDELKLQLEQKDKLLENAELEKAKLREKTLLEQFPNNTQCVYYGIIDNVSNDNEPLIKFGNSNFLKNRVTKHKDTYSNFILINAFKVENKLQIENALKNSNFFYQRQRTITLKNKKYMELLNIKETDFKEIDKIIKEIIISIEYSPENYIKLLEENKEFKKIIEQRKELNKTNEVLLLTCENKRLKEENAKLLKKYNKNKNQTNSTFENDYDEEVTQEEIENYPITMNNLKKRVYTKTNGCYNINGKIFESLYGSREQVWEEKSYKTSGGLTKNDLIMNKSGKIVSKKKSIHEFTIDRFAIFGINEPKL
jgi:hypothetical protein